MRPVLLSLGTFSLFLALACAGGAETTTSPAPTKKGKKSRPADENPEEIICCEFKGAKGTSTRKACSESKGVVHPRKACP